MNDKSTLDRLLEADIKALILNYLRDKKVIGAESIIMNELTVGNFSRRVDLAIYSNGKLIAFEIKSEADTLSRLSGQIETYLDYFDKVIVVSDTKFIPKILNDLPKDVGVWEVKSSKIKVKAKGKYQYKIDNQKLINFMDVVDLVKISTKLKIQSEKHRYALEESLLGVSNKDLRIGVQISLNRKFKGVTQSFIKETKDKTITKEDLKTLSRFISQREEIKRKEKKNKEFWENIEQHVVELTNFVKATTPPVNPNI